MKIAIIGPGAMGVLYGAKLSQAADVVLIGNNAEHVAAIREHGVMIKRNDEEKHYPVSAIRSGEWTEPTDLVILFTKAYLTREAIKQNAGILGPDTMLLTLQNGMGHEEILHEFADEAHILIGTTTQGSSRENAYTIINSGLGDTVIGTPYALNTDESGEDTFVRVQKIAEVFQAADFPCTVSTDIRQTVWNKLMINASSSVLSGVLQEPQGFVVDNESAWSICQDLIREICGTAVKAGCRFDAGEQIERIRRHLREAHDGYPSICMDLKYGRKTEVDYINGAVVKAAERQGMSVPTNQLMVRLVHAMEAKR